MKSLRFEFGHDTLASKCQDLKLRSLQFHFIRYLKNEHPKFKDCILNPVKIWLHYIRIKYWKSCGSGNPPSLIPVLWNIGILLHNKNHPDQTFWAQVYTIFFLYTSFTFGSVLCKYIFPFSQALLWTKLPTQKSDSII